jgi:hypothetical protein
VGSLGFARVKNSFDDAGDKYARLTVPLPDTVLTEQSNQYSTCTTPDAYPGHNAIFNA